MAYSREQLILLNNLMYMDPGNDVTNPLKRPDGYHTVAEWINSVDVHMLDDQKQYGSFMTGKDWKNILHSVRNDPDLMGLSILETHTDWAEGGGGGYSAVFKSTSGRDAIVAFRGTAANEWQDNFTGGNVAETPQQKNALNWYQKVCSAYGLDQSEITVTGHSKGGNKSKYITLMDDTVDHCVSFDGQGFSDKFMDCYKDEISIRQHKIHNHNVDYDYVNLLLNDVGDTTFYEGQDLGDGGFLENHCPNTFLKFQNDGSCQMIENLSGQGSEMKAADEFLNCALRSMPDGERTESLEMVNDFIQDAFSINGKTGKEIQNIFLETATSQKYKDNLAYLLAYAIKYEQNHPEFADQIRSVLMNFGMSDFAEYADIAKAVLNFEIDAATGPFDMYHIHLDFQDLLAMLNGTTSAIGGALDGLAKIPGFKWDSAWALRVLCDWIREKTGIDLEAEQLRDILDILSMVDADMESIQIQDNGADRIVTAPESEGAAYSGSASGGYQIDLRRVREWITALADVKKKLADTGELLQQCNGMEMMSKTVPMPFRQLITTETERLNELSMAAGKLAEQLSCIASCYEQADLVIRDLFMTVS